MQQKSGRKAPSRGLTGSPPSTWSRALKIERSIYDNKERVSDTGDSTESLTSSSLGVKVSQSPTQLLHFNAESPKRVVRM